MSAFIIARDSLYCSTFDNNLLDEYHINHANISKIFPICNNFLIVITLITACLKDADAYVCILRQRWDPVTARHRWAMPSDERCNCMGVVAPEDNNPPLTCPLVRGDDHSPNDFWWFTDNKAKLTNRDNWTPETLNKLLKRAEYCSKYLNKMFDMRRVIHSTSRRVGTTQ